VKNILIYSNNFFAISETFIYRQVKGALPENKIHLLAHRFSNQEVFPLDPACEKLHIKQHYGLTDRLLTFLYRKAGKMKSGFSIFSEKKILSVLSEKKIHLIHAHYGESALRILPVAKKSGTSMVVSFHGYDASKSLRKNKYKAALPALFDYVDAIVIVSKHMSETLDLEKWKHKTFLIPYGVDINAFTPKDNRTTDRISILHSGRLVDKKGVPDLIRVFSRLVKKFNNATLHILGDGSEREACEALVDEYQLKNLVRFYGAQPQEKVMALMNECNVFVLNSRTAPDGDMEGLPNSILEAMSMEMAVISTRHAAIPDVIENGISGLLVGERENEQLLQALSTLSETPQLIKRLGFEARKRVTEHFTIEKMQSRINAIYNATNASKKNDGL
jgi:colanic acid/amylovoran biosynthesis glycosyltransferase